MKATDPVRPDAVEAIERVLVNLYLGRNTTEKIPNWKVQMKNPELAEARGVLLALLRDSNRRAVSKMHDDIMELDKLILGTESDAAYNYGRVHNWIDSYIERKLEAGLEGTNEA